MEPVRGFQTRTVRSRLADASRWPLGLNATPQTARWWPVNTRSGRSRFGRLLEWGRAARLAPARRRFLARTELPLEQLYRPSVGDFLEDSDYGRWLELLTLYAYSTPRAEVREMSAAVVTAPPASCSGLAYSSVSTRSIVRVRSGSRSLS